MGRLGRPMGDKREWERRKGEEIGNKGCAPPRQLFWIRHYDIVRSITTTIHAHTSGLQAHASLLHSH